MLTRSIRNWWSGRAAKDRAEVSDSPEDASSTVDTQAVSAALERARGLRARGECRAALAELEPAARRAPDDVRVLLEQATLHGELGELSDAHDCYQLALAHEPGNAAALLGLARTLRVAGDAGGARTAIESAVEIDPRNADIQFEAATIYGACDDLNPAVLAYRRGLELDPANAAAWANLGLLYLSRLGDAREAQRCFERALTLVPVSVEAQANLGLALEEQGRIDDALAHYEKLIAANPHEPEFRWNRGLALLAAGDYARGWDDYEMRNALTHGTPPRKFPFPVWHGEQPAAGASLLIYGEQGVGDEIMFASCVPDVLARGIGCVIECDPRLESLFRRAFSAAQVHGVPRDGDRRWLKDYPQIAMQCAIGSLPQILRRSATAFPRGAGYLKADPQRVTAWRKRLAQSAGGPCVGLAWRGGTRGTRRELRSLSLAEFVPLLELPGIIFINLQRGGAEELAGLPGTLRQRVIEFSAALDDFEETAALCAALDRVVTADNSLAHLAGALGCPTSILLPFSGDWRWVRGETVSPWYPSVTLHRQVEPGAWPQVVSSVRGQLGELGRT